ncbi:MAG: hypothetical protein K2O60_00400 [Ruminococcus sp.]|nr:hypothetical protein [Ruminococcus sp.]
MITLRSESFIKHSPEPNEKISIIRAEIDVDTRDELPEIDGISERILHQGSTALIITECEIAILGGDGKWYINGEVVE